MLLESVTIPLICGEVGADSGSIDLCLFSSHKPIT